MNTLNIKTILLLGIAGLITASCTKWIEIPPSKSMIESNIVFSDSASATSALLGVYATLGTQAGAVQETFKTISVYADEYNFNSTGPASEFNNGLVLAENALNSSTWTNLYAVIYQCNSIIAEVELSAALSANAKQSLQAEARFLRAYTYFYLVNLYDHVPLILTTDVNTNVSARQSPAQAVYEQIITDLQEAKATLGKAYKGAGKVRANAWVASALLSRVFLYQEKWAAAEKEAAELINSGLFSPLPALENVFLANSKETILQFWSTNGFISDATSLIPASATVMPAHTLSNTLKQAFEAKDGRSTKWIATNLVTANGLTTPYPYAAKYKNRVANTAKPEYVMALRLSEQYLIRAEALAHQNKVSDAVDDLNLIRARATGIPALDTDLSKQQCLDAIAQERRIELFGECGHRFFDLKRTGKLTEIMQALKPAWKATASALPIPQTELTYNTNLIPNEGY
jgi:hypothetical protein